MSYAGCSTVLGLERITPKSQCVKFNDGVINLVNSKFTNQKIFVGQVFQPTNHATRHIGNHFFAVGGREPVQHAVVAAHVQHGSAVLLGRDKVE